MLLYIAKHFGEKKDKGIIISHHFTQQDIATLTGIARETASKEIEKLEKKGLIKYANRSIMLKNMKALNLELSNGHKR